MSFNLFIAFVLSGVSLYYYVIRKKSQKSIEKFKEVCDKLDYDHQSAELEVSVVRLFSSLANWFLVHF